jgi:cytochrome P450
MLNEGAGPIPDHVPAELIEENFPLVGGTTYENPFTTLVPEACKGPDIAYVPNMMHGGRAHAWILRRNEDLEAVYKDVEHFSNKDFANLGALIGESWQLVPAEQDPPQHTLYRQLLNPLFSPGAMAKMEGVVRKAAEDCIAHLRDKTECEFINDFSFPFPVGVVLDLMGLPRERMAEFQTWENQILHSPDIEGITEGVRNVTYYLREVFEERKKNPGDDLLSHAIKAEIDGRKLSDNELIGYGFNFFIGGLDTVTANTSNFVRYLAENQEMQRDLREHPEKIQGAIEEFFRAFAAVTTYRTCSKETQIRGVTIKPGDRVAMITTLAGRDAKAYDNPHEVRLDRSPRHLTFATGPHHCLGVHLARREVRVAMEKVLETIPQFRLKEGVPIDSSPGVIIQPRNLPLVWD